MTLRWLRLSVVPTTGPRSTALAAPHAIAGAPLVPWPGCEVRRMCLAGEVLPGTSEELMQAPDHCVKDTPPHIASGALIASIFAITSGVSLGITSTAPRLLCNCESFDAPVITVLTRGFFATHAMASCDTLQPSSAATPSSSATAAFLF